MFYIINSTPFNQNQLANKNLFNINFSGGFSGILTQEIREYRSLAYASSAKYKFNFHPEVNNYMFTYIGCQADKTNYAVSVAFDLLKNMPEKPDRMDMVRSKVILSQNSEFPNFRDLSEQVEALQIKGYDSDPREKANELYPNLEFTDIVSFYKENVQNQKIFLGIYGDSKRFDLEKLGQFGKVKKIEISDIIQF